MLSFFSKKLTTVRHPTKPNQYRYSYSYLRVPPEVLEEILLLSIDAPSRPWRSVASHDMILSLTSYALVCKRWATVAFPLLYQSWLVISGGFHGIPSGVVPLLKYGELVKVLSIEDPAHQKRRSMELHGRIFQLAATCLISCPNTQDLHMTVRIWYQANDITQMIDGISRAKRLRKFTFRSLPSEADMLILDLSYFGRIAEAAPQLENIQVVGLRRGFPVLSALQCALPPLVDLRELTLIDAELDQDDLAFILRSTPNLQHLHASFLYYSVHALSACGVPEFSAGGLAAALAPVAASLITLNLRKISDIRADHTYPLEAMMPSFKKLRSFTLLQRSWDGPSLFRWPSASDLGIFKRFPSSLRQFRISTTMADAEYGALALSLAGLPKAEEKWRISFAIPEQVAQAQGVSTKAMKDDSARVGFLAELTKKGEHTVVDLFEM